MKKRIKKIAEFIFVNLNYLLPSFRKNDIQNIYYHEVVLENGYSYDKINFNKFKQQMYYLIDNHYNTLNFEDLNNYSEQKQKVHAKKNILITFDDGYCNNFYLVYPFMKKLGLKFNIFLEVDAIDKKKDYLTWDMVNEMKESGIVNFGAHTLNHVDARFIDNKKVNQEILKANDIIYNKTGIVVEDFCFPYGAYDDRIVRLLDDLKVYKRLYTSDGRMSIKKSNTILIGRIGIENEDSQNRFVEKVKGKHNLLNYTIRTVKSFMKGYKNEIYRQN